MRRAANVWDRFYHHQPAPWRGEHLVTQLVPRLGPGPVLELGCGNGKMVRPLIAAGLDVVALDISWNVLAGLPMGSGRVLADAASLPFREATFSAVLDIHCTGHLLAEGRKSALTRIASVVRPGGIVVSERLAPDDLRSNTGKWLPGEIMTRELADGRTTCFTTAEGLVQEFTSVGLQVEEIEAIARDLEHRGRPVRRSSVRAYLRRPSL